MKETHIRTAISIQADASGNPPASLHLMSTGHWHAPWHGNFEMTPEDLAEMVVHFEEGVGSVEGSKKLPINYGHDVSGKAAGWMVALRLDNNGDELWADVEWTKEGARMLADGEFKYISPEWNPRSYPYQDPEDEDNWLNNVVTGAGLTNNPLFKKLKPIMASILKGNSGKPKQHQGGDMDLAALRGKKKDELSADELAFVEEHKTELTDDERTEFGLTGEPTEPTDPVEPVEPVEPTEPTEPVKASAGQVSINASELAQLKAAAARGVEASDELRKTRLAASVDTAISRGAIKSGHREDAVTLLMASSAKQEASIIKFIANLPDNKLLASEIGDSASGESGAEDELMTRAAAIVKDTAGKTKFGDAMAGLMASDSVLRDRVNAERSKSN